MSPKTKFWCALGVCCYLGFAALDYEGQFNNTTAYPSEMRVSAQVPKMRGVNPQKQRAIRRRKIIHRHKKMLRNKRLMKKATKADLKKLHEIGNKHCRGVDKFYGYKRYVAYHGNYWSFFKTHHYPMYYTNDQHSQINRKVLAKHNVKVGINFERANENNDA